MNQIEPARVAGDLIHMRCGYSRHPLFRTIAGE
jgi:hypothetical protein